MGGLKGGRAGREEGGAKTEREEEEVRALENRLIFFFINILILQGQSPSHLILITILITLVPNTATLWVRTSTCGFRDTFYPNKVVCLNRFL